MAAIFAASPEWETILLESTPDGGRKILISGGGRCNILPATLDPSRFVTDSSPHTLRKLVRSWPLADQIRFFESEVGIPLIEETQTGKLFPVSNRARDVRDGLIAFAARRGVRDLNRQSRPRRQLRRGNHGADGGGTVISCGKRDHRGAHNLSHRGRAEFCAKQCDRGHQSAHSSGWRPDGGHRRLLVSDGERNRDGLCLAGRASLRQCDFGGVGGRLRAQ